MVFCLGSIITTLNVLRKTFWPSFGNKIKKNGQRGFKVWVKANYSAIWYHLYNLKNVKTPMEECYFYKSNTPPWVFFTFFWILQMVPKSTMHHIWNNCKLTKWFRNSRNKAILKKPSKLTKTYMSGVLFSASLYSD